MLFSMNQPDDACTCLQVQRPAATHHTNSSTPSTVCRADGARADGWIGSTPEQPSSTAIARDARHASATVASTPTPTPPSAEVGCWCTGAELAQARCAGVDGPVANHATLLRVLCVQVPGPAVAKHTSSIASPFSSHTGSAKAGNELYGTTPQPTSSTAIARHAFPVTSMAASTPTPAQFGAEVGDCWCVRFWPISMYRR